MTTRDPNRTTERRYEGNVAKTPTEMFGSPQGGSFISPRPDQLAPFFESGKPILVAHWNGWQPMKIVTLELSEDDNPRRRSLLALAVETPHGGRMDLSATQLRESVRIPDPEEGKAGRGRSSRSAGEVGKL